MKHSLTSRILEVWYLPLLASAAVMGIAAAAAPLEPPWPQRLNTLQIVAVFVAAPWTAGWGFRVIAGLFMIFCATAWLAMLLFLFRSTGPAGLRGTVFLRVGVVALTEIAVSVSAWLILMSILSGMGPPP
jgi:hypothetical protein